MGRQLPVAVSASDAVALVNFIHEQVPCRLFLSHALSPDDLCRDDWDQTLFTDSFHVLIWPTLFDWQPKYAQAGGPGCPANKRGSWYLANATGTPLLEFSGNNLFANREATEAERPIDRPRSVCYGRVFWANDFGSLEGVDWDVGAFSKLVDKLWRWIRKTGKKRVSDSSKTYFFPDAWQRIVPK